MLLILCVHLARPLAFAFSLKYNMVRSKHDYFVPVTLIVILYVILYVLMLSITALLIIEKTVQIMYKINY